MEDKVNHPAHYGGDTPYEAIKVIEAWELGFNLGNSIKYISRAGKKGSRIEDLQKAAWYLQREINNEPTQSSVGVMACSICGQTYGPDTHRCPEEFRTSPPQEPSNG